MTPAPANTPSPRISRPRPRLRKAAKWGGLILSILLVAAWGVSVWVDVGYFWQYGIGVRVDRGTLLLGWDTEPALRPFLPEGWFLVHPPMSRAGYTAVINAMNWTAEIPFYAITLPTITLTLFAWRRDAAARRRALHNHCPACGYDRAGLFTPDALCPECGAAAPTAAPAT